MPIGPARVTYPKQKKQVGTLALGTGNDLSRSFKFGGGWGGDNIANFLSKLHDAIVVRFDRWSLLSEPEAATNIAALTESTGMPVSASPPLNVINNYFSVGTDALTV